MKENHLNFGFYAAKYIFFLLVTLNNIHLIHVVEKVLI